MSSYDRTDFEHLLTVKEFIVRKFIIMLTERVTTALHSDHINFKLSTLQLGYPTLVVGIVRIEVRPASQPVVSRAESTSPGYGSEPAVERTEVGT